MPSHLLPRVGIYVPVITVFGAVPRKGRVDLGVAFPQPPCGFRLVNPLSVLSCNYSDCISPRLTCIFQSSLASMGLCRLPVFFVFPFPRQILQLSLQYPDFALGILLFGNFVFAMSRWPVLAGAGGELMLRSAQPGRVSTSTAITGPGCGGTSRWLPGVGVVLHVIFQAAALIASQKDMLRFGSPDKWVLVYLVKWV